MLNWDSQTSDWRLATLFLNTKTLLPSTVHISQDASAFYFFDRSTQRLVGLIGPKGAQSICEVDLATGVQTNILALKGGYLTTAALDPNHRIFYLTERLSPTSERLQAVNLEGRSMQVVPLEVQFGTRYLYDEIHDELIGLGQFGSTIQAVKIQPTSGEITPIVKLPFFPNAVVAFDPSTQVAYLENGVFMYGTLQMFLVNFAAGTVTAGVTQPPADTQYAVVEHAFDVPTMASHVTLLLLFTLATIGITRMHA